MDYTYAVSYVTETFEKVNMAKSRFSLKSATISSWTNVLRQRNADGFPIFDPAWSNEYIFMTSKFTIREFKSFGSSRFNE